MPITRNLRRLVSGTSSQIMTAVQAPMPTPTAVASPWQTGELSSIVWGDLLDVDVLDRLPATRAEAMAVPAIARARHVVCTTIARLPLREYPVDGADPLPHDQQSAWITRTDVAVSAYHRMLWTVDDLIFHGWSLWASSPAGEDGRPLAVERVDAQRWTFDSDGRVIVNAAYPDDTRWVLIPGPHEGILNFGRSTVRHATRIQASAAIAAETPVPTMELHQISEDRLDPAERDAMLDSWRRARRHGGVGYTNRAVELRTHGMHSENLLVEGRNAAAVDCARLVSVPASTVDATPAGASLTYSNTEMRNRELVDYGLSAYTAPITARLSLDDVTPRGRRVSFDLDEFLPAAPLSAGADAGTPTGEDTP